MVVQIWAGTYPPIQLNGRPTLSHFISAQTISTPSRPKPAHDYKPLAMAKDWSSVQEEIRQLYHVENKPLNEVMRVIKGRHGFHAW